MDHQHRRMFYLVFDDLREGKTSRYVVHIKEACQRAVGMQPIADLICHNRAVSIVLRVVQEYPNLLEIWSKVTSICVGGRSLDAASAAMSW